MKKIEMNIYQSPQVEVLDLKMEGMLCVSTGTEDVNEGWNVELE